MKTVKANNFKKALEELLAIDDRSGAILPEQISEADKDHYVVALIKRDNNEALKKYETRISIQQFDAQSFQKLIKNVAVTGYDYAIVLHNPDNKGTSEVEGPKVPESEADMRKRIEAELRQEFEAKLGKQPDAVINTGDQVKVEGSGATLTQEVPNAGSENAPGAKVEVPAVTEGATAKNTDISGYTIAELKAFAEKNEISEHIKGIIKRDDIIATLQTWQKES